MIFLSTADCKSLLCLFQLPLTVILITVVMILRVYAMWNRSKWILCLLLFIYIPQVIVTILFAVVYDTSTYLSGMSGIISMRPSNLTQISLHPLPPFAPVTIIQLIDFSVCNGSWSNTPFIAVVFDIVPRFVLGATLLILAVIQTLKQSINMYKATKQWQPNRYMERLVRDGVLYFLVYVSVFTSLSFPSVTPSPSGSPTHSAPEYLPRN